MSNIFKYCDRRGVVILRNLELKITPPNLILMNQLYYGDDNLQVLREPRSIDAQH